ncbi:unnamed protein product [Plutella xylostella]|uniref:(diamondback moth) hypothetical protein n=1 Tax=Plutella xylostella TaxID=51655 RepID=A0A8S4EXG6_PLUXY|nr:unnamed protein product [Plutella xylostella]
MTKPASSYSLHGFCDASELGFAAVVYLRSSNQDGSVSVHLLMAKSKVAPLRTRPTIPKLELCGAVLLVKLLNHITEYANSEIGSKPYLPRTEELCIAKCEPYTQWFRAVLCELTNGPGSETAEVLYLDYGNLSKVPTSSLRKCLRDFIELPAVAVQAYIADFPKDPTPAQLEKAKAFLSLTPDGEGQLEYTRAEMQDPGSYTVYAPALIQAMM